MAVYKVLVQKFSSDNKVPFQTKEVEVCADSYYVDAQEVLSFHNRKPEERVATFASGCWYQVRKVEKTSLTIKGCWNAGKWIDV